MAHARKRVLEEGDLRFTFTGALKARHFDAPEVAKHKGDMSVVDFIVDFPRFDLFVEVKDPDNPEATHERVEIFERKLKSGALNQSLARKYRDSWLYRWAEGREQKPVHYGVLLQLSSLRPPALMPLAGKLKRVLPRHAPDWTRSPVDHVAFFTMSEWNRFGRYGQVERISSRRP